MLRRRADGPPANARATTVNDGGASKTLELFLFQRLVWPMSQLLWLNIAPDIASMII
jgi:hypothetical protein